MTTWTIEDALAAGPCAEYTRARVAELWAGREALTPTDVAELPIPAPNRLWALLRMAPPDQWMTAIYALVNRALRAAGVDCPEVVDADSALAAGAAADAAWAARAARAARDAARAARDAAWAAWAALAAARAARDAARAARDAAWAAWAAGAAAGAAARDTEYERIVREVAEAIS